MNAKYEFFRILSTYIANSIRILHASHPAAPLLLLLPSLLLPLAHRPLPPPTGRLYDTLEILSILSLGPMLQVITSRHLDRYKASLFGFAGTQLARNPRAFLLRRSRQPCDGAVAVVSTVVEVCEVDGNGDDAVVRKADWERVCACGGKGSTGHDAGVGIMGMFWHAEVRQRLVVSCGDGEDEKKGGGGEIYGRPVAVKRERSDSDVSEGATEVVSTLMGSFFSAMV